jgi:hypothetical protein
MSTETISIGPDLLWGALLRLGVNTIALLILIRLIYYRYKKSKPNVFSFFLMGTMIFLVCVLLKGAEMNMGMALGLFAIFSVIRFRTRNYSMKDIAYLFSVIGISAINAMFDFPNPVRGTILVNLILILTIFILEIAFKKGEKKVDKKDKKDKNKDEKSPKLSRHLLQYDNLKLLGPDKKTELLEDISGRTGIKIEKIKIRKIDLIKNSAELDVFFKDKSGEPGK